MTHKVCILKKLFKNVNKIKSVRTSNCQSIESKSFASCEEFNHMTLKRGERGGDIGMRESAVNFAGIILPAFLRRLTQICFFLCIYMHARTSGAIVSTTDKTRSGTRKRAFNVYFESHLRRVAHRPKWAFERWFIIRVDARAKSPARFHCSCIIFFFKRRTAALFVCVLIAKRGGEREDDGRHLAVSWFTYTRLIACGSCYKNSIAFFFIRNWNITIEQMLFIIRRKSGFKKL